MIYAITGAQKSEEGRSSSVLRRVLVLVLVLILVLVGLVGHQSGDSEPDYPDYLELAVLVWCGV